MGIYLNPNANAFLDDKNTKIYVDKSLIVKELNELVSSKNDFVCISRPRRFGKSMAGNLVSAYYSKGCDTRHVFSQMKLGKGDGWDKYLNRFNVIKLDMNGMYQNAVSKELAIEEINETVRDEFVKQFPNVQFKSTDNIAKCVRRVYDEVGEKFVIIIDEYDVLVRENVSEALFEKYLSFLNGLFKDASLRPAIALAYITGIFPIVRDKIQSKLNEFDEYTIINPLQFAGKIGFTKEEVACLCDQYEMDKDECERWYDGYKISDKVELYNPLSVVKALRAHEFDNYWTATSSFVSLKQWIMMDFDGVRQDIISMIAGKSVPVNVLKFENTIQSINCKDNVFTYLIHLGYLAYNRKEKTCCIPNMEIRTEWINCIEDEADYGSVMSIVNASKQLLDDTINGDAEAVANALGASHTEVTSNLTYNDEYCFQSAICLAYFYATTRYTLVKELPTGKGYADLVLIPYLPNFPAMVIELKCNQTAGTALQQIKDKNYSHALNQYKGDLLFVGINYDKTTKVHTCRIEKMDV